MAEKTIIIHAETGLHTRPAAEFVKLAKTFDSTVTVSVGGKSASAKSLFKLQLLELVKGTELVVEATGSDEQEAVDALADFLAALK